MTTVILPEPEVATPKTYIKWVQESVASWEVEHFVKGVDKTGFRNLAVFLDMVGLEEKYVRVAIKKAEKAGERSCIVSGWKISWMSAREVRVKFKGCGVVLSKETRRLTGRALANKEDWGKGDYELHNIIDKFMVK